MRLSCVNVSASLVVRTLANAKEESAHIVTEGPQERIDRPSSVPGVWLLFGNVTVASRYHPLDGVTGLARGQP
jgi:hypothetical protein